jgi:hypothetical protein
MLEDCDIVKEKLLACCFPNVDSLSQSSQDPSVLSRYVMSCGKLFPTFREMVVPPSLVTGSRRTTAVL